MTSLQPDADGWYQIQIHGDPVPKGRARFRIIQPKGDGPACPSCGKPKNPKPPFMSAYTPKETADHEELIAASWKAAGGPLLDGRLQAELFFVQVPQKNGEPRHEDWDNLGKLVCDALNKVAYADDRYFSRVLVEKLEDRRQPLTVIRIRRAPPVADFQNRP
jgi:Holliday junction resolvase RusA-like endonuclease